MSDHPDPVMAAIKSVEDRVDATSEQLNRRLDRLSALLMGPHADKPGLVVRIDRIEQLLRQVRWVGGMIAAVIGSLASWAMTLLSAKH